MSFLESLLLLVSSINLFGKPYIQIEKNEVKHYRSLLGKNRCQIISITNLKFNKHGMFWDFNVKIYNLKVTKYRTDQKDILRLKDSIRIKHGIID